jgi:hypothetical protein
VESAVNTTNKRVLGYLLEEVWTALPDVNAAISERLREVNHDIRRVDGSTRFERFTQEEAGALLPLPRLAFEQVAWKELKVGRNYHVTCDYQHYSVPFPPCQTGCCRVDLPSFSLRADGTSLREQAC